MPREALTILQCYFLLSAAPKPILYHVDRVRDGRSYSTRAVRAQQNGKVVFIMLCSFQRPEPWQVRVQQPPPPDVPSPEDCEFVYEGSERQLRTPNLSQRVKDYLQSYVSVSRTIETHESFAFDETLSQERKHSFLSIKRAGIRTYNEGITYWLYWYKVNGMPQCSVSFQKVYIQSLSSHDSL